MTAANSAEPVQPVSMPLAGHLAELRNRLIWSIVAVAIGGVVGFAMGEQLITLLRTPLPPDVTLQQI